MRSPEIQDGPSKRKAEEDLGRDTQEENCVKTESGDWNHAARRRGTPKATRRRGKEAVMVNSKCHLGWTTGYPDTCSNMITLSVSVTVRF